ncbi:MAG: alpha/beta hydrolase [Pseudomonadota bacterium]
MPSVTSNGINIHYESYGDSKNETVLLVMGLATQLTAWPVEFCQGLVDRGYHVVCFDNRDIGLSTHLDGEKTNNIPMLVARRALNLSVSVSYQLEDMADDALGLLDALDVDRAHVVGASMGGMIAQLMAALFPDRVQSLTSIMSTTGHRSLPGADLAARRALLTTPEDPSSKESVVMRNAKVRQVLQSPIYPKDFEEIYGVANAAYERSGYDPEGINRQLSAIVAAGHRRAMLRKVECPALVIHGAHDPLVKMECGIDTAQNLSQAELLVLHGMGHDFPAVLVGAMIDRIHATAQRASH